jgi:hypothetical protein
MQDVIVEAETVEKVSDATVDIDATLIQPLPTLELQLAKEEAPIKSNSDENLKPISSKLTKDDELCEHLLFFYIEFDDIYFSYLSSVHQGWNNVLFSTKRLAKRI